MMSLDETADGWSRHHVRLAAEAVALYIGVPIAMAAMFGSYSLFAVVWALAAVAAVLLAITPGFRWRMLLRAPERGSLWIVASFTLVTGLVCVAVVQWLVPHRFLALPTYQFGLWIMIMTLYPVASALPQELIYRSLFFERYGALFPTAGIAIAANGAAFGIGHLFYMNPVTIGMTAIGGAIMGWAYLARGRSVLLAWILHSIAGQILFTAGLGAFFYHGAIG